MSSRRKPFTARVRGTTSARTSTRSTAIPTARGVRGDKGGARPMDSEDDRGVHPRDPGGGKLAPRCNRRHAAHERTPLAVGWSPSARAGSVPPRWCSVWRAREARAHSPAGCALSRTSPRSPSCMRPQSSCSASRVAGRRSASAGRRRPSWPQRLESGRPCSGCASCAG